MAEFERGFKEQYEKNIKQIKEEYPEIKKYEDKKSNK